MDLRHLRSLVTLAESDFSVSRTAERLHLVQPAVSQHLKQLEDMVGAPLFVRHGKRLAGLTQPGDLILRYSRRILAEAENILAVGRDHRTEEEGVLRIGATHTQARYVLPPAIRKFSGLYPAVEVQLHQGTPQQLVEMAVDDAVDVAICTEALHKHPDLTVIPCYRWNRCVIAPIGHPVLQLRPITLGKLCEFPVITYVFGFTGSGHFRDAFARLGLRPRVVLGAADTDVIKTYVREQMGIGIIARLAYSETEDADLEIRDLSHLFPWEVTKIAYRKDKYLRRFQQRFIDIFQDESAQLVGRRL